jgi:hypothetical protein
MAGLVSLIGLGSSAGSFLSKEGDFVFVIPAKSDGTLDTANGKALQYWPSELTDNQSANYSSKTIPGGNLPLYQWIAGGERVFSFTAVFSRDQAGGITQGGAVGDIAEDKHNVDIPAAVNWLRSLMQPTYEANKEFALPPPLLYLVFPANALGIDDTDHVLTVLTSVNVTTRKWFPNGVPRYAEVALTFSEVVQKPGKTVFYGAEQYTNIVSRYTFKKGAYKGTV